MLPVALEYPPGIEMVSVCTVPAMGGRWWEHFGGYKTINQIPLPFTFIVIIMINIIIIIIIIFIIIIIIIV